MSFWTRKTFYATEMNVIGLRLKTLVPELLSDHEEADTRMILHASHASRSAYEHIILRSDTDVFVISLNASSFINGSLYLLTGSGKSKRVIPVTSIQRKHGQKMCSALIGFHAFTG